MPKEFELLYPLYLDVPMLAGLLASTAGAGDDLNLETTQGLLSDAGGTLQQKYAQNVLFGRLLKYWQDSEILTDLSATAELKVGDLIEFSGEFYRNPLATSLEAFLQVMNISGFSLDQPAPAAPTSIRRGPAAVAQASETNADEANFFRVFQRLHDELNAARVQDLVMYPEESDLSVVVSVLVAGLPEGQLENLLSGNFRVIGKVSQVLPVGEELNLHQRTSFGYIQTDLLETSFADLKDIPWIDLPAPASFVAGPAIQLVPLAILA